MVLPVRHFRVGLHQVAIEGAFAEHLRMMRSRVEGIAKRLVVASPSMRAEDYASKKSMMAIIDEDQDGIVFETLLSDDRTSSIAAKARQFLPVMRSVRALVKRSVCVHSGLSWDVWLPFEFASIVFGILLKRRSVFVVDIDYRKSALMMYRVGDSSWKSYALCRYVYDTARSLQVWAAARYCQVVLLKGRKMAADFGAGRPNVHCFLDASHGDENMIDADSLQKKVDAIRDPSQPLRLTYFGRLTAYKGIDRCVQAVALARQAGAKVELDIIGGGEQMESLQALTDQLNAGYFVRLLGGHPFNQEFFHLLYQYHLLLAAPLREDTPRSALDAMAAGIPYLAFDTYYYKELLESRAGRTVPWLDVEAMAQAIVELDRDREKLVSMVVSSVAYAGVNTQQIWLERRLSWTLPE